MTSMSMIAFRSLMLNSTCDICDICDICDMCDICDEVKYAC